MYDNNKTKHEYTFKTKVTQFSNIWGKGIPANLNRVPDLETKDEEKLHLPVFVRGN